MTTTNSGLDPNLAFRLFFQDPDWRVKSGIGGVLTAGAFLLFFLNSLFIPLAFALWALLIGYNLRLIRSKIADMNAPLPKWNDWLDLLISGLTWIAVAFGQNLLPIFIATGALLVGGTRGSRYVMSGEYPVWAAVSVIVISLSWALVSLTSTIIKTNFARQEKMSAAFDIFTVGRKLASNPAVFIQAWLLVIGLTWLGVLVPTITIIGVVFVPICSFVVSSVGAIILAQAWRSCDHGEPTIAASKPA